MKDAKRLKELEKENTELKKIVADHNPACLPARGDGRDADRNQRQIL